MDERIGVEVIPAVRMEENLDEALQRLRQMFVDVNENAKRLSSSEIAQLDETNGYRVVSRRLLAEHPLLRNGSANGEERTKVDPTRTDLREGSDCYTTLSTLADIVKFFLKENKALAENNSYASWDNLIAKGAAIRPEDSELERGRQDMTEYFDCLATYPPMLRSSRGSRQASFAGPRMAKTTSSSVQWSRSPWRRPLASSRLAGCRSEMS